MRKLVLIDGGIGRCIAATGVLKSMGNTAVVTSFPYVFDGVLDRHYPSSMPWIYEDHIKHDDYLTPEPYNNRRYYAENQHFIEVLNWQLTGKAEFIQPQLVLSPSEEAFAEEYINTLRGDGKKKVMLLQPYASTGGTKIPDETYRSIDHDTISTIIDTYKDTYSILIVKAPGQAEWSDTISISQPEIRRVFALIPFADVAICCDSFLQHAIAGLGSPIPTVVLWGGTSEKSLGYKEHTNLRIMDVDCEPNRVLHSHSYYVNKNKGCNNFLPLMDKIKEIINGTVDTNGKGQCSTKDNSSSKASGAKSCGHGCRNSGAVHKGKTVKAGA